MKNIWLDGIMGVVIGDALGMPVQFMERNEVKKSPVTGMEGYGTYNMPPGTWSDDSSMTLATLDSIQALGKIDYSLTSSAQDVSWSTFIRIASTSWSSSVSGIAKSYCAISRLNSALFLQVALHLQN